MARIAVARMVMTEALPVIATQPMDSDRSHGGGSVGRQDFTDQAKCVGEFILRGDDRKQCAFRKGTMPDFAPSGALHPAGFTGCIRRHVVVMDITLEILIAEAIQCLAFADGTQRGNGQGLSLPTGENRAAVRTGQNSDITPDRTDFGDLAAVWTNGAIKK